MKNNKTNTLKSSRFAALKLAEIKATDKEDMSACVADMQKFASLSSDEAKVVAGALRAKYLPSIARKAGLDEEAIVNLDEGEESASFAEDLHKDHDVEDFSMEDNEDDVMGDDDEDLDIDLDDDNGEDDDDDIATFEIEVPADMLEAAQKAVQEALDKVLGGNSDVETDSDFEDFEDDDEDDTSDDEDMAEEPEMHTKEEDMDKKTLAARRAMRNELLKKVAAEEAEYPSAESFKYNDGLAQYEPAVDYPTMQMEDSAGNSLKDENPTFDKTKVPTNNPGNLAFPESMDVVHMSGGEKTLEYVVDFKKLENPSEGIDVETPEIPTQTDLAPRKATASEKHDVVCQDCKSSLRLSQEEIDADVPCPHCEKKNEKEAEVIDFDKVTEMDRDVKTQVTDAQDALKSLQSVNKARITTSYSCASKLAIAGIISMDEVDVYAEQMLNDNLKTDAMLRQTKLLLKAAQTSVERVASAAAEKMNVRTASTVGISTSPALSITNSAALDIQNALKGTWSMPKIED
jgi:hypothetical protein